MNATSLPDVSRPPLTTDTVAGFTSVIENIGGKAVEVKNWQSLVEYVSEQYSPLKRIISTLPVLPWFVPHFSDNPHTFEDVDLAILEGHFGVAENGAVWITDTLMGDRSIPFIAQHLALVINKKDIVPTLYEAYEKIESQRYNFGTFIAGPSKTADIEQSLVLGAHGPKSMIVFLLDE
jgi:L-lactate dehydrogenase complex protein LldG